MGSGPSQLEGADSIFPNVSLENDAAGEPPTKTVAQKQALAKVSLLLANKDALDALCKDLFESMSDGESSKGTKGISQAGLRMLTRVVINGCQVSDPASLQELLDVLVPLHSQTSPNEESPHMRYDGFLSHARCVLRVIDAVLQAELNSEEGAEVKTDGVNGMPHDEKDIPALPHHANGVSKDVFSGNAASSVSREVDRRVVADTRAVIVTAEDLREADGVMSLAAAVAEAAMPESVVPGGSEPIVMDFTQATLDEVMIPSSAVPAAGKRVTAVSPTPIPAATLPWPLPSPSHSRSGPWNGLSSPTNGAPAPLPVLPSGLSPSPSRTSLSSVRVRTTAPRTSVGPDAMRASGGSRSRAPTPMGGTSTPAAMSGQGSMSRTTAAATPRSMACQSAGLPSTSAPRHCSPHGSTSAPRHCSPHGRVAGAPPVSMPSVSSGIASWANMHAARSQSPLRTSVSLTGTGSNAVPNGPLGAAGVGTRSTPTPMSGMPAPPVAPLVLSGTRGQQGSPLRAPSRVFMAPPTPHTPRQLAGATWTMPRQMSPEPSDSTVGTRRAACPAVPLMAA